MSRMTERHFQPLRDPFEVDLNGTRLLEAGAGTGKTWTIAALVVRLLLEQKLDIRQIQVVTYTRAATAELRGRIRARLSEALQAFELGQSEDAFLGQLLQSHGADDRREAQLRLRLAIESFDEAAIHTIHGFCQRALAETAFAAGQPFVRELVAEQTDMLAATAREFWRKTMAAARQDRLWTAWLMAAIGGPDQPVSRIRAYLGREDIQLARPAVTDRQAAEQAFMSAFDAAQALWRAEREHLVDWVRTASLRKNIWSAEKIKARIALADQVFRGEGPRLNLPEDLGAWGGARLARAVTKQSPPVEHSFFDAMDALLDAAGSLSASFDNATRNLLHDFLLFARQSLAQRKQLAGQQSYDDLLTDLAVALRGPHGEALAAQLRQRCRAVLVDEFQDTDTLQLDIFFRAFHHPGHPLIFVGDPKQAIYGFRGADVFAYLEARQRAEAGYALQHNRRSDPPLLTTLNALFNWPQSFLLDDLPYERALPADMTRKSCRIDDAGTPFSLWVMEKPAEARTFTKELAIERVAQGVAADIARLLGLAAEGRARMGDRALSDRPLSGGDIAVLVRKRQQGETIRQALAARGIASVSLGGGSIWQTDEATEIERVLLAIAAPSREGLARAALATQLIGVDATTLAACAVAPEAWAARLSQLHDDQVEYRTRGFMAMWRRLLRRESVVARMLRRPDGERKLTNYRHLAERLQLAEEAEGLDIEALARHIAVQREQASAGDEEAQLRLESDAQLVRIVTIHAAKGLQYPIVYCPFLWDGPRRDTTGWPVMAHRRDEAETCVCLDFGTAEIDRLRDQADFESAAEELRLAYVALTRAEHRCIVAWGKVSQCECSPLAHLLFAPRDGEGGDLRSRLAEKLKTHDEADLRLELDALAARLDGALAIVSMPDADGLRLVNSSAETVRLAARPFNGTVPGPWYITSFSGMAARANTATESTDELPDRDAVLTATAVSPAPTFQDIHGFPRGTRAGSCLHALLERVDFQSPNQLAGLAENVLTEFGFDSAWQSTLTRMVADVLATPLNADGLRLADVSRRQRIVEMGFNFPVSSPAAMAGYMKGFIDLVFQHEGRWYIVDYKSNWLGSRREDYAQPYLDEAMKMHRYDLQLKIYSAALRRALAARAPQSDWQQAFGGVFYLFLRGMGPDSSNGVFFAKPSEHELERFDRELAA